MKFLRFKIINFKGIESATVEMSPSGANIFTLIGLNESGKTTVLEAISFFGRAEAVTKGLFFADDKDNDPASFVPKHKKSNFSGDIIVRATLTISESEKLQIVEAVESETGSKIFSGSIPNQFDVERGHRFLNSDRLSYLNTISVNLKFIKKAGRKQRDAESGDPEWKCFAKKVNQLMPQIVYFPTFLFSQPKRIYMYDQEHRENETSVNRLYRQIVENVAASLSNPLDVQEHIVKRVLSEKTPAPKLVAWMSIPPDKQEQITAAINEIQAHLSETVFARWSRIFGGSFSGREIILRPGIEMIDEKNVVYIEILLKDGTSTFSISERSLGFRWFFSFVMFTLYRVSARNAGTTFFLLDEPASNLHSRAQMQLLDSLPRLSTGDNQIMFSTHSHYMINPEWLDQSFIVSNSAVDYDDLTDQAISSKFTNVNIKKYRNFVGQNPNKQTYFQPVLDKLDIVPSRIDLIQKSVLVEGKGDYLYLEYGLKKLFPARSFAIVPTRGAAGMDELIGLFLGWGVPFMLCLDDDVEGKCAAKKYVETWCLTPSQVITLGDVSPSLKNKTIESFLEDSDILLIKKHLDITVKPTKSQKQLFFSEMLASNGSVTLSSGYFGRIEAMFLRLQKYFEGV